MQARWRNSALVASIVLGFALTGCSSKLAFVDPGDGLPIPTVAPYVEYYALHVHSKGEKCQPVIKYRHVSLPGKEVHYVNIDAKPFAKSGLAVKYTERGTVSEVAFNTEPSADAITAATTAASTLLPFLGILSKAETSASGDTDKEKVDGGARVSATTPLPACDAGELLIALAPLSELTTGTAMRDKSIELSTWMEGRKWN